MKEGSGNVAEVLPVGGSGAVLVLSELENMAARQQREIAQQKRLLEQREARLAVLRGAQEPAQQDRLARLRHRLDQQQSKLNRLRLLRSQTDQSRANNATLTSDLDCIRALFNEKEKELSLAVAKVEELTRQLEELRGRRNNGSDHLPTPASAELEKLRRELMYRNKMNEQQNQVVSQQRLALVQRQAEMASIDARIAQLQGRLQRKRALNQRLSQQLGGSTTSNRTSSVGGVNHANFSDTNKLEFNTSKSRPGGNIAAIEPYSHIPSDDFSLNKHDPKYQTLPYNTKFTVNFKSVVDDEVNKNKIQHSASASQIGQRSFQQFGHQIAHSQSQSHIQGQSQPLLAPVGSISSTGTAGGGACGNNNNNNGIGIATTNTGTTTTTTTTATTTNTTTIGGGGSAGTTTINAGNNLNNNNNNNNNNSSNNNSNNNNNNNNNSEESHNNNLNSNNNFGYGGDTQNLRIHGHSINQKQQQQHGSGNVLGVSITPSQNIVRGGGVGGLTSHQKPVSSVAPSFPVKSPIYQTSSTKIHPVMPQTLSLIGHGSNGSQEHGYGRQNFLSVINQQQNSANISPGGSSNSGGYSGHSFAQSQSQQSSNAILSGGDSHVLLDNKIVNKLDQSGSAKSYDSHFEDQRISHDQNHPKYEQSNLIKYGEHGQGQVMHIKYEQQMQQILQQQNQSGNGVFTDTSNQQQTQLQKFHEQQHHHHHNHHSTKFDPPSGKLPDKPFDNERKIQNQFESRDRQQDDKTRPALPPKPTKPNPPPRLIHHEKIEVVTEIADGKASIIVGSRSEKDEEIPPIPTTEPPESPTEGQSHHRIIKARPLTLKKAPLSEQPKLRYSKSNVHVSINRRIEMPPAFLFPETEIPADLMQSDQSDQSENQQTKRRSESGGKTDSHNEPGSNDNPNEDRDIVDALNVLNVDERQQLPGGPVDKIPGSKGVNNNINNNNNNNNNNGNKAEQIEQQQDCGKIDVIRRKKGNLKSTSVGIKANVSRRVSFDPLALLLDASLEGELELVKKTAREVANPSSANDEGITALHNAICAGHLEIVKFLVEFGCDVNAQDSDGWTPLHCAASCNNLSMVRFLVEHGACIFATTLSDHETAAEKCEEDEEGFDGCSEYLYSVQEKLGIMNNGQVFAVFDYEAQHNDELSLKNGDSLVVLRKGDDNEREWWWSKLGHREGYVPRNLLGLYARVQPAKID